jgi:zinc protease
MSWFDSDASFPSDPEITTGVLPNGLRYCLQPNSYPQNRIHTWLEVNTGSCVETDAEQGLAHYLEHCVFLSTDSFPGLDDLRKQLTELGMSYGGAYCIIPSAGYLSSASIRR